MGFHIWKYTVLTITCLVAHACNSGGLTYHCLSECLTEIYAVYRQGTCGLTIVKNQCDVFASSRWVAFFAIPPRLLVSKGTSHCHFLLRRICLFHLKYIRYIIFDTFSPFKEKIIYSKQPADFLTTTNVCIMRSRWRHLPVSSLIPGLSLAPYWNLSEITCPVFHKKPPIMMLLIILL